MSTFNMEKLSLKSHTAEVVETDATGSATIILGCDDLNTTKLLTKLTTSKGDVDGCWAIANPSFGLSDGEAAPHFTIHARLPSADEEYDLKVFSNTSGTGDSFSSAVHYKLKGSVAASEKFPMILTTAAPVSLIEPLVDTVNVGDTVTFKVGLSPAMESARLCNSDGHQAVLVETELEAGVRIGTATAVIGNGAKVEIIVKARDNPGWNVFARYGVGTASDDAPTDPPQTFDAFLKCGLRTVSHVNKLVKADNGRARIVLGATDISKVKILPRLTNAAGENLPDNLVMISPRSRGPNFIVDVVCPEPGNYILKLHVNADGTDSFTSGINYDVVSTGESSSHRFPNIYPMPLALLEPTSESIPAGKTSFRIEVLDPSITLLQVVPADNKRVTFSVDGGIATADADLVPGLCKIVAQAKDTEGLLVFTKFNVA